MRIFCAGLSESDAAAKEILALLQLPKPFFAHVTHAYD